MVRAPRTAAGASFPLGFAKLSDLLTPQALGRHLQDLTVPGSDGHPYLDQDAPVGYYTGQSDAVEIGGSYDLVLASDVAGSATIELQSSTDSAPNAAPLQLPSDGQVFRTSEQVLAAVYDDPNGGDGGAVQFKVYNSLGTLVAPDGTAASGSITGAGSALPTGVNHGVSSVVLNLPDGAYTWTSTADDGIQMGASSTTTGFTVNSTPPADQTIAIPSASTDEVTMPLTQPVSQSYVASALSGVTASSVEVSMSTPTESDGGVSPAGSVSEALSILTAANGAAPITLIRISGADGVTQNVPQAIARLVDMTGEGVTSAVQPGPIDDAGGVESDPTSILGPTAPVVTKGFMPMAVTSGGGGVSCSGTRCNYPAWAPYYGRTRVYQSGSNAVIYHTFTAADGSTFSSDWVYEHDFKLYETPTYTRKPARRGGTITACATHHWYLKHDPHSYSTNMPNAYFDYANYDDDCGQLDMTVGSRTPRQFVGGHDYYIRITSPRDFNQSQSKFGLEAQELHNECPLSYFSPNCVNSLGSIIGAYRGRYWTLVGTDSTLHIFAPGCRFWWRGFNSQPC